MLRTCCGCRREGRELMSRRIYFSANVRYGDIVARLYASHLLEPIYRGDVKTALGNCLQVLLRPGGTFRHPRQDTALNVIT